VGPRSIRTENGQLAVYIVRDHSGRDWAAVMWRCQAQWRLRSPCRSRYSLEWSGKQFEISWNALSSDLLSWCPLTLR